MDSPHGWLSNDVLDGSYKFTDWVSQHSLDLAMPSCKYSTSQPSFNDCEYKPFMPVQNVPHPQHLAVSGLTLPVSMQGFLRDPLFASGFNLDDVPPPPPPLEEDEEDDTGYGDDGDNEGEDAPYCRPTSIQLFNTYPTTTGKKKFMQSFPPEKVNDFKHVIYNLLVDNHNNGGTFVSPCTLIEDGVPRNGFSFDMDENPEKKLPELYAMHVKKASLHLEDQNSIFIKDLYKFYLRACVELLGKYFEKRDKYTYLYAIGQEPLFVPNGSLQEAEQRIRSMKTKARRRRKTT